MHLTITRTTMTGSRRLLIRLGLLAALALLVTGRSSAGGQHHKNNRADAGAALHGSLTTTDSVVSGDWSGPGSGTSSGSHQYGGGHKQQQQQRLYATAQQQQQQRSGRGRGGSDAASKSVVSPVAPDTDETSVVEEQSQVDASVSAGEEQSQVDSSVAAGDEQGRGDWSTTVSSANGSSTQQQRGSRVRSQQQQQQGGGRRGQDRDGNCSSRCKMFEETISLTKEAIKQEILNKLGLKQPPNITGRALPRIPPLNHLLDIYGMQSDAPLPTLFKPGPVFEEAEDDYHAKTEKVISFAQEPPKAWSVPSTMEVQYFKFSHSVMANKVLLAKLWVHLNPSRLQTDTCTLVHVYKVARSDQKTASPVLEHVVSSKVDFKPRRGGWVTVDIKKLVADWFRNPQNNLGVVVQAFDKEGHQLVATDRKSENDIPFVEVYGTDESKKRTKRMIGLNCEENSNEVRCCRYPLVVDFEEFGWDWIIAPKKYEANYCSGECPYVFLQKYPHTHLVQQANPSGSAGPCCAPRKMSPISMLYFDQETNIIYGLLPGMVVDRCGCS